MRIFFDQLVIALSRTENTGLASNQYIKRLVSELKTANLTPNPPMPDTNSPSASWMKIFEESTGWKSDSLLCSIHGLDPIRVWLRADDLYPEFKHRYFSKNVWGALIAGQNDALFNSAERFIALLIVIDADTVYPLHAHRIEELYYVLSGCAQWSHDGKDWETLPPGSIFHNSSYQAHTMRTFDHPLMAMGLYLPPFGWEGGLLDTTGNQL